MPKAAFTISYFSAIFKLDTFVLWSEPFVIIALTSAFLALSITLPKSLVNSSSARWACTSINILSISPFLLCAIGGSFYVFLKIGLFLLFCLLNQKMFCLLQQYFCLGPYLYLLKQFLQG